MVKPERSEWLKKINTPLCDRDRELLERCIDTLIRNIPTDESLPWYPKRLVVPSIPRLYGIWNWDTAFHAIGLSRFDMEMARENISTFMQYQNENGMPPDVVWAKNGEVVRDFSKPPVMPWAVKRLTECEENIDFIKELYPKFILWERFLTENRKDRGLFYYDVERPNDPPITDELYKLWLGYDTGWDNAVRWDKGVSNLYTVDLNCYMVMYYRAMSFLAEKLNINGDKLMWNKKEKELIELINKNLWDDQIKAYVDVDRFTGESSRVLSPASFMPLFIEIAPYERAVAMNELAGDKDKFFPGMPTVSYDDPEYSDGYWRGLTWLNVAYFATKGLKNYGFETADKIKDYILTMVRDCKDGIYENYDSKKREGRNSVYFSWSAVFIIEFILNF